MECIKKWLFGACLKRSQCTALVQIVNQASTKSYISSCSVQPPCHAQARTVTSCELQNHSKSLLFSHSSLTTIISFSIHYFILNIIPNCLLTAQAPETRTLQLPRQRTVLAHPACQKRCRALWIPAFRIQAVLGRQRRPSSSSTNCRRDGRPKWRIW